MLPSAHAAPAPTVGVQALNQYLTEHGYGWMQTDTSEINQEFLPVTVNGREMRMLIDTGCFNSGLTRRAARSLKLNVQASKFDVTGVGGIVDGTLGQAHLASYKIGPNEINRVDPVWIFSDMTEFPLGIDGTFGFDFLQYNAVMLPVGSRILFYKSGPRQPAGIDSYMTALGFIGIPMHYVKGNGLAVGAEINGHPFTVLVDCGCMYTSFDLDFVCNTAHASAYPIPMKMSGADGRPMQGYAFTPRTFSIGGLKLPPGLMSALYGPAYVKEGLEGLLGYDVLSEHHAVLDFGQDVLWLR